MRNDSEIDRALMEGLGLEVRCLGVGWRHLGRREGDRVALVQLEPVGRMLYAWPYAYAAAPAEGGWLVREADPSLCRRHAFLLPAEPEAVLRAARELLGIAGSLPLSAPEVRRSGHVCPCLGGRYGCEDGAGEVYRAG